MSDHKVRITDMEHEPHSELKSPDPTLGARPH
jgi:hypothetical protein